MIRQSSTQSIILSGNTEFILTVNVIENRMSLYYLYHTRYTISNYCALNMYVSRTTTGFLIKGVYFF